MHVSFQFDKVIILPLGPAGPEAPVFPVGPAGPGVPEDPGVPGGPGGPAGPTRTFPEVLWPCWPEMHQKRMNAKHSLILIRLAYTPPVIFGYFSKTTLLSSEYLSFFNLCETTVFTSFWQSHVSDDSLAHFFLFFRLD